MDVLKYKIQKSYAKNIFSFIVSSCIGTILFTPHFILHYLVVFINSLDIELFFSSKMFQMYISMFITLLIQNIMMSLINYIVDILYFEDDYLTAKEFIKNIKITKEEYFRYITLKNIPLFSLINAISILFNKNNLSLLDKKLKIHYEIEIIKNKKLFFYKSLANIGIAIMTIQFIVSSFLYMSDSEIKILKDIDAIEVVQKVESSKIIDKDTNNVNYNLNIHLQDGYIHYNKLKFAKEESLRLFNKHYSGILTRNKNKIETFNLIFYNDYAKSWDKIMYDKDLIVKYEINNISSDIENIDIFINDRKLTYNIFTNLLTEELRIDVSNFFFHEFKKELEDVETQNKIKEILNIDTDIEILEINILSKEYDINKVNTFYTYTNDIAVGEWNEPLNLKINLP